jgi:hypothetical protein
MNKLIHDRLESMRVSLLAAHAAGARTAGPAPKGHERETFVRHFLSHVLPPAFRISSGDITDATGKQSGPLDLVIEYPLVPSLPAPTGDQRMFLAEGVAAVIDVKANLSSQWDEVRETAKRVRALTRSYAELPPGGVTSEFAGPNDPIPYFVVGYTGWRKLDTLKARLAEAPEVDGILVLDSSIHAGTPKFPAQFVERAWSLWALMMNIQQATQAVAAAQIRMAAYVIEE